jgi:RHS repeat-associated protein
VRARVLWFVFFALVTAALSITLTRRAAAQTCLKCPPGGGPANAVGVSPHGGTTPTRAAFTGSYSATYTVSNTGSNAATYDLICHASGGVTCGGVTPSGVTLLAFTGSANVTVTYSVGAVGTGKVTLVASGVASDSGWYSVPVATFGVAVTPDGGATLPQVEGTAGFSQLYTVTNTGSVSDTYTFTCAGGQYVRCTPPANVTVGAGLSAGVTVSYGTLGAPGTGALTLRATSTSSGPAGPYANDTGWVNLAIVPFTVSMTPDAIPLRVNPTSSNSQAFTIQHAGSASATYAFTVSCTGAGVSGCTTPAQVPLSPGASTTVSVSYSSGALGTTGRVRLTASQTTNPGIQDSGWADVTVGTDHYLAVNVDQVTPTTATERGACVAVSAGTGAAYECGDLRLTYGLPAIKTLNKARAPILLYNTQVAHPYPVIAANATLASTAPAPDSVVAVLFTCPPTGCVQRGQGRWTTTGWVPGRTYRLAVGFDALAAGLGTGIYAFNLQVTAWYGLTANPVTVAGRFIVVDRSASPFGSGWWLAGYERLYAVGADTMLWVGGDGSARAFRRTAPGLTTWVADQLDFPDTISFVNNLYTHTLRHGVKVIFKATGADSMTQNRLGQVTAFGDSAGILKTITLPPAGSGRSYAFGYDVNGKLTQVTSSAGSTTRTTAVTTSNGRITSIRTSGGARASFGYDPAFANRVVSRTDSRGNTLFFAYDAAGKLASDSVPLGGSQTPIVTRFRALEGLGTTTSGAADTASAYTRIDGPRVDVADTMALWLDRFGAPRRVVNAKGYQTLVVRGDARWPLLVTQVQLPTGFVTNAGYDARGNLGATAAINPLGDGRDALTQYHWNAAWDFVDTITTPSGVVTSLSYDATNGNRLTQQLGPDVSRRVTFRYGNIFGLLSSTVLPGTPADSIQYDVLGNLAAMRTPRVYWTTIVTDAFGRDTLVITPTDSADHSAGGANGTRVLQRTVYDSLGRDTLSVTTAPPLATAPQQTITVRQAYDSESHRLSLSRTVTPDGGIGAILTRWHYDAAGRVVAEIAPDGYIDSTLYDPAGNAVQTVTRRGDTLYMNYDPLNRLVKRVLSQVQYPQRVEGIAAQDLGLLKNRPYPYYATDASGGYTIARDSSLYDYDPIGNYTFANNSDAQVQRTYYRSGLLNTETQQIRTVAPVSAGGNFTQHAYTLTYRYDLDGRRTVLKHPSQLAPTFGGGPADSVRFGYDAQIGELSTVYDPLGNLFTYTYSPRGELQSIQVPTGILDQRTYDADGNLVQHNVTGKRQTTLQYDARGKLLSSINASGYLDTTTATYDGLGYLESSRWVGHAYDVNLGMFVRLVEGDAFDYDGLGNSLLNQHVDTTTDIGGPTGTHLWTRGWNYAVGTGRLVVGNSTNLEDTLRYDPAGNTEFAWQKFTNQAPQREDRASYYAADGTLRAADYRSLDNPGSFRQPVRYVFEEYRYDALGRRVWVRARKDCENAGATADFADFDCHVGLLRRTVWDGNRELWEMQVPGDDLTTPDTLENDIGPIQRTLDASTHYQDVNPFFGRVAYTYGLGVDQPLSLMRAGYADQPSGQPWTGYGPFGILPFWNYRGQADTGFTAGGAPTCQTVNTQQRCVKLAWPFGWDPKSQAVLQVRYFWHGTLIESKRDKAQTLYMRNRVYDPKAGRFTQEDPLGLAGGLNLYGFANGDPVNFSDPFGLCPCLPFVDPTAALNAAMPLPGREWVVRQAEREAGITMVVVGLAEGVFAGGRALLGRAIGLLTRGGAEAAAGIPKNALNTLKAIRETGEAPAGYRGGSEFLNDGRGGGQVLPGADAQGNAVSYREWDVNPQQPGVNRGAERLVTGSDGSAYFTGDHYKTFTKVPE